MHDQEQYFSGKKLLGDDYKEHEILQWFKEEKEAYVDLINSEKKLLTIMNIMKSIKFVPSTILKA